jgi:hypothetical protein
MMISNKVEARRWSAFAGSADAASVTSERERHASSARDSHGQSNRNRDFDRD